MRTCACRGGSRGAGERCESEPRPQAASASSYIYMSRCLCLPWRNVASRLSRLRGGPRRAGRPTGRRVMTRRPELRSTSHERPDRTSEPAHGRDSSRRRGQRQPINVERERQASRRTERSSAHTSLDIALPPPERSAPSTPLTRSFATPASRVVVTIDNHVHVHIDNSSVDRRRIVES